MERLKIEVTLKNNSLIISLNRTLDVDDFANVDERDNAILFILEEDKGWTFEGKKAILKIQFINADEIKKLLDNNKNKDAAVMAYAINLWKVHRLEVNKKEATKNREFQFKEEIKKLLEKSIKMINQKAEFSF